MYRFERTLKLKQHFSSHTSSDDQFGLPFRLMSSFIPAGQFASILLYKLSNTILIRLPLREAFVQTFPWPKRKHLMTLMMMTQLS